MDKSPITPICITPGEGNFTFGYYDCSPWDASQRYHLAIRMPFQDHLPSAEDQAAIGVVDLQDKYRFIPLAQTYAWNHQQGSRQHWIPGEPDAFIYNDARRVNKSWKIISCVHNLKKGKARELPRPIYSVSPNGGIAATLDFGRLYKRMGYSYAGASIDSNSNIPDDDGVWIMDIRTGASKLICSIRDLADMHPFPYELGDFVWLDTLFFNKDGSRLMVLFKYYVQRDDVWRDTLFTMDIDGGNRFCALPHPYWEGVSHQIWGRTPKEILLDAHWRYGPYDPYKNNVKEYVIYDDGELKFHLAAGDITLPHSGHLVFSPDGRFILADTYPMWHTFKQQLRLVDLERKEDRLLGEFFHGEEMLIKKDINLRCDLHPRWRPDGGAISFDSIMTGDRKIYMMEIEP